MKIPAIIIISLLTLAVYAGPTQAISKIAKSLTKSGKKISANKSVVKSGKVVSKSNGAIENLDFIFPRTTICKHCSGKGTVPGVFVGHSKCTACNGTGKIKLFSRR